MRPTSKSCAGSRPMNFQRFRRAVRRGSRQGHARVSTRSSWRIGENLVREQDRPGACELSGRLNKRYTHRASRYQARPRPIYREQFEKSRDMGRAAWREDTLVHGEPCGGRKLYPPSQMSEYRPGLINQDDDSLSRSSARPRPIYCEQFEKLRNRFS